MPTVKIIPAMPGRVSVASNKDRIPINNNKLVINVILAINPKIFYLTIIKITTKIKPMIKDNIPAFIESCLNLVLLFFLR